MIKPTYISIWIAFGIVQLISSIKEKKIKELINYIKYMLIGILIIMIPIILYLIINDAWKDFIEAYIEMNMKYSQFTILEKFIGFITMIKESDYILLMLCMIIGNISLIWNNEINRKTKIWATLFFIISCVLTAWSPRGYGHYLIQLAPCVAIEITFLYYIIKKIKENKKINRIIQELPINFIFIILVIILLINISYKVSIQRGIGVSIARNEMDKQFIEEIRQYVDTDDKILVLGNRSYYYEMLNKQPDFKYFFQYPIIMYDKEIQYETKEYIKNEKPKIIINEIGKTERIEQTYSEEITKLLEEYYDKRSNKSLQYYILKIGE